MKEFLSRDRHAFVERNVEHDPDAYRELVARGWRTVPLTVIGDRAIRGFDAAALGEALRAAAAPPPDR